MTELINNSKTNCTRTYRYTELKTVLGITLVTHTLQTIFYLEEWDVGTNPKLCELSSGFNCLR